MSQSHTNKPGEGLLNRAKKSKGEAYVHGAPVLGKKCVILGREEDSPAGNEADEAWENREAVV